MNDEEKEDADHMAGDWDADTLDADMVADDENEEVIEADGVMAEVSETPSKAALKRSISSMSNSEVKSAIQCTRK
jgi:hypothetical protein